MKSKMTAVLLILLGLVVWTSSSAWARDHRDKRQGEGFKTHQHYGKNQHYRPEKWDRQGYHRHIKKHHKAFRHYRYRHGHPAKHYYHYRKQPRPDRHHGAYKGHQHGHDVLNLGVSIWQPGMSFGFMVSDWD